MMSKHYCKICDINFNEDDENKPECPLCQLKRKFKTILVFANVMDDSVSSIKSFIEEELPK